MADLEVVLVTTDRTVWTGQAESVSAPAYDGQIGILKGHSPLLASLGTGVVEVGQAAGKRVRAQVSGGFFSVDDDKIMIIADEAELLKPAGSSH